MATEKSIQICGKTVLMRYCAATETGYEKISGKSSAIFVPEIEKDEEGNIKEVKSNATTEDYIILAVAAPIPETPISSLKRFLSSFVANP